MVTGPVMQLQGLETGIIPMQETVTMLLNLKSEFLRPDRVDCTLTPSGIVGCIVVRIPQ